MILQKLNPKYTQAKGERTHITLDCPLCQKHKIAIPIKGRVKWDIEGEDFDDITLSPSILHDNGIGCKSHFFIKKGKIIIC